MLSARTLIGSSLAIALVAALTGCGKKDDKKAATPTPAPTGGDATAADLELDGQKLPFMALGAAIAYEGQLAEQDGVFQYHNGRAFKLAATTSLLMHDAAGNSSDCAIPAELSAPTYMVMKVDGADVTIAKSSEEVQADGQATVAATPLAEFPGELAAGTYALVVDYFSGGKACHVKGGFTLGG